MQDPSESVSGAYSSSSEEGDTPDLMNRRIKRALKNHQFGVAALNISWIEENSIKDSDEESDSIVSGSSIGSDRDENGR